MFRHGQTFMCLICVLRAAEVASLELARQVKMRKVCDQVALPFADCESDT